MTVIAYDGKLLVADGRACRDTEILSDSTVKLFKQNIKEGKNCATYILGLCGAADLIGPYLAHLADAGFLEPFYHPLIKENECFLEGIAIDSEGKAMYFSTAGALFELHGPVAIGSGCTIAGHYLRKGENAINAVKETFSTEVSCGGNLTIFDCEKGKFIQKADSSPVNASSRASSRN